MLTKEQRAELAESLASPWGDVTLLCDGRRVTLQVQRMASKTRIEFRVMTYIDGQFKGLWCMGDAPESRFLRKQVRRLISPAKRKADEKLLGKRWVAKQSLYNAVHSAYLPDWPSGKAAIDHLCKVCESVEIAPPVPA
jgi:hypothetical protein